MTPKGHSCVAVIPSGGTVDRLQFSQGRSMNMPRHLPCNVVRPQSGMGDETIARLMFWYYVPPCTSARRDQSEVKLGELENKNAFAVRCGNAFQWVGIDYLTKNQAPNSPDRDPRSETKRELQARAYLTV